MVIGPLGDDLRLARQVVGHRRAVVLGVRPVPAVLARGGRARPACSTARCWCSSTAARRATRLQGGEHGVGRTSTPCSPRCRKRSASPGKGAPGLSRAAGPPPPRRARPAPAALRRRARPRRLRAAAAAGAGGDGWRAGRRGRPRSSAPWSTKARSDGSAHRASARPPMRCWTTLRRPCRSGAPRRSTSCRCRRSPRRSPCPRAERFVTVAPMREFVGVAQRLPVLSVSDLNRLLRASLEADYAEVWVAGEISSFRAPGSGHLYFRLKDGRSQIAAVMFRSAQRSPAVSAAGRPRGHRPRPHQPLRGARRPAALRRHAGAARRRQRAARARAAQAAPGGGGPVRRRPQAPLPLWPRAVGVVTAAERRRDPRHRHRAARPSCRTCASSSGRCACRDSCAGADIAAALAELATVRRGRGGDRRPRRRVARRTCGRSTRSASRAPSRRRRCRWSRRSGTRSTSPWPTWPPTAVPRRRRPPRRWWCPTARELHAPSAPARTAAVAAALRSQLRRTARTDRRRWRGTCATRAATSPPSGSASPSSAGAPQRAVIGAVRVARTRLAGDAERLHALSPLAVLERGYAIARRDDGTVVRAAHEVRRRRRTRAELPRRSARVRVERGGLTQVLCPRRWISE